VVELFRKLEATPRRARESDEFMRLDKELHRLLGLLGDRICSAHSVLDRKAPLPTDYPAEATYREAMRIFNARGAARSVKRKDRAGWVTDAVWT
jgi:hypothetical protein